MEGGTKVTQVVSYVFPAITLIIWLIIATALFATFKFAAGAGVSFKVSLAIVIYSALPLMLKTLLALLSVAAGMSPDSFSFQNPVATNPGYFMTPADNVFLYSVASGLDIFMIWTLGSDRDRVHLCEQGEEWSVIRHRVRMVGAIHIAGCSPECGVLIEIGGLTLE